MSNATGYLPRDYKSFPVGSLSYETRWDESEIPLMSMKEAAEKCEHDAEHSLDPLGVAIKTNTMPTFQNGYGYCHSEDTEVLTEKGWCKWPEYDGASRLATVNQLTHAMEFQTPLERQVFEYDGPMVHSSNRRVDFAVTPNHRMYVRPFDGHTGSLSTEYKMTTAGKLGWYTGLLAAPEQWVGTELVKLAIDGDRQYDGDTLIKLLSVFLADGYVGNNPRDRNHVSFCCFNGKDYDRVKELAYATGFTEQPSRRGVFHRHGAPALAEWLRANCYEAEPHNSLSKRIPQFLKSASRRQVNLFLEWYGDRNRGDQEAYYSSNYGLISDLQELLLRVGRRGTISTRPPQETVYEATGQVIKSKESYQLYGATTDKLCLDRKKHISQEPYKGLVYCATVPNSTLVTRRNGTVLISGNCWSHAGIMAQKISMAQSGMVVPRLSATGPACLIKGYRNRGGNATDIIPWLAEHGAPTVEFWEENSTSRSNDTPEMRENAKLHRVLEWWVLPDRSDQHKWTALANGYAIWSGYANIGHAMCSARFFLDSRGRPGCLDINSWNKGASNATAWQEGWMRDRNVIYQRIGGDFTSFEQYAVRVSTVAA